MTIWTTRAGGRALEERLDTLVGPLIGVIGGQHEARSTARTGGGTSGRRRHVGEVGHGWAV